MSLASIMIPTLQYLQVFYCKTKNQLSAGYQMKPTRLRSESTYLHEAALRRPEVGDGEVACNERRHRRQEDSVELAHE